MMNMCLLVLLVIRLQVLPLAFPLCVVLLMLPLGKNDIGNCRADPYLIGSARIASSKGVSPNMLRLSIRIRYPKLFRETESLNVPLKNVFEPCENTK